LSLHVGVSRFGGTARCWIVQVQRIKVDNDVHNISNVPLEFGEDTKWYGVGGIEQLVANDNRNEDIACLETGLSSGRKAGTLEMLQGFDNYATRAFRALCSGVK